jgi:hypothetical protein
MKTSKDAKNPHTHNRLVTYLYTMLKKVINLVVSFQIGTTIQVHIARLFTASSIGGSPTRRTCPDSPRIIVNIDFSCKPSLDER